MRIADRISFWGLIAGIAIIGFVAGVAAKRYETPPGKIVNEGLREVQKMIERKKKGLTHKTLSPEDIDFIGANSWVKPLGDKQAYGNYTLISLRFADSAYLIDMDGEIVHRWYMPYAIAWPKTEVPKIDSWRIFIETAHVYPNGDLLAQYSGSDQTPYGYGMVKMDKDSNVLWTYNGNTHHDFHIDEENGNIYVLTQAFLTEPLPGIEKPATPLLEDFIVKLSPDGKELDKISVSKAFADSPFALMLYAPRAKGHQPWDYLHANSIMKLEPSIAAKFPLFKAGQILISIRSMNAIAVIDPSSRKVVWAYGGGWIWQHAARFLANGRIMVFDNRGHVVNGTEFSRVIEFDPNTLRVTWHYASTKERVLKTTTYGRLQPLPNGNVLMVNSSRGQAYEIAPDGTLVWSYSLPQSKSFTDQPYLVTARRYEEKALPFLAKLAQTP